MNTQNKIHNIAIIHPTLGYRGGAENVIISTVREFCKLGINSTVYTNTLREDLISEIAQIKTNITLNPLILNKTAKQLLNDISNKQYNAIIMHNFPAAIFWGKVCDLASRRNITLPNSFWYCHEPSVRLYGSDVAAYKKLAKTIDPIARATMKLDKHGVSNVGYIFANSCRTSEHVMTVYARESTVVYPCTDYDSVQSYAKDKKHFLCIGRIEKPKNIDIAINAFKKFLETSEDKSVEFIIAGKGRYEKQIAEHIAKRGLAGSVKMLGYISEEQKHEYISKAYALISLADNEPFGLSVVEAWVFGSTAIISKYSGASEVALHEQNAMIVDPHDENAIAGYMTNLVSDRSCREAMYKHGASIINSKRFAAGTHATNILAQVQKYM